MFDVGFDRLSDMLAFALPDVGEPALAPLAAYTADRSRWDWGRSRAASALGGLGVKHPELRGRAVAALADILAGAESDTEIAATGVLSGLIELQAAEELPLIRRAFELGKIDEMGVGAWADVLGELGVPVDPADPLVAASQRRFEEFSRQMQESLRSQRHAEAAGRAWVAQQVTPAKRSQEKARKQKNKRKAAAASRKANRKKR